MRRSAARPVAVPRHALLRRVAHRVHAPARRGAPCEDDRLLGDDRPGPCHDLHHFPQGLRRRGRRPLGGDPGGFGTGTLRGSGSCWASSPSPASRRTRSSGRSPRSWSAGHLRHHASGIMSPAQEASSGGLPPSYRGSSPRSCHVRESRLPIRRCRRCGPWGGPSRGRSVPRWRPRGAVPDLLEPPTGQVGQYLATHEQDGGTQPGVGVGRPAVVGGEVLAFRWGEMDTGHGSTPPRSR